MCRSLRKIATLVLCLLLFAVVASAAESPVVTLHFFWGEGCPHCEKAKPFVADLGRRYPRLQVREYEVFQHPENLALLRQLSTATGSEAKGVPTFILGERMFSGFNAETAGKLEERVAWCLEPSRGADGASPGAGGESITVPLIGTISAGSLSLPVFTLIIAGLDSFNPCAFFVLFFLLSLMTHVHSRSRMLLIGGIYVFFSGFIYFLFMAAWLNLFILAGNLPFITIVAGILAMVIAIINIKDFFWFEQGVSLVIPEQAKPKLFERMREIIRVGSLPAMIVSTVTLSVAANTYELLCTAGFPMVFTRVLTLHKLPAGVYYLYLALYNVVYAVPLAIIVAAFAITLGSRKLSEWQGRLLKLVSGSMMLCLGSVLLIRPALLNSALLSCALLGAALLGTWLVVAISRRVAPERFR